MSEVAVPTNFDFHGNQLRNIIDEFSNPWFVASDICSILEIQNTTQALNGLDEDERSMQNIGRNCLTNLINESGLYTLIIRSNKPKARQFRKWITSEVLPAIRKTGQYRMAHAQQRAHFTIDPEFTREGEYILREFRLGLKIAKASGLTGAVARKRANTIAKARTGVDFYQYFNMEQPAPSQSGRTMVGLTTVESFVHERCVLDAHSFVATDELFGSYESFCRENSYGTANKIKFFACLYQAFPEIKKYRPSINGGRVNAVTGITLKGEHDDQ